MTRSRLCGSRVLAAGPDGSPVELPGRQLAVLYARLALADGRPVARDELVEAVWGEETPPTAQRTLSALLSRLRGLLGPDAVSHGDAIALRGCGDVDVLALLRDVAEAEAALAVGELDKAVVAARRARDAVAGPLLPGHPSPWAHEQRERVEDALARATEAEAGALVAMGDPRAVPLAREVVAHDPFRESAVVLLVDALLIAGDPAGALRAYEALRIRLRDDLGTVPGPRARAAHRRALEAELGSTEPWPSLVGREAELARIASWLEQPGDPAVLALRGERGIGLSTLVRGACARAKHQGWLVARGACPVLALEDHGGVAEALRDLVAQLDDGDRRALAPAAPPLAALVPALGQATSADGRPLAPAVAQLLLSAARGRRVLLVVEDLHRAEPATLRLLQDALIAARGAAVRVLLTSEAHVEGVTAMLGALRRGLGVADLEVGRLPREAVKSLVARHGPAEGLPADVVEELWDATCGHPLLLVELLRDITAQPKGGRGPVVRIAPAVRELVLDASQELPASARQVLALVAAAGRPLPGSIVAAAFRRDADEVAADLDAARSAGILERRSDGAAAFNIPIIGRAIREDLDPLALRGLNLRLARAMAEDPVARPGRRVDVALHLLAAEELTDREEVGRAAAAAAREAMDDHDPVRAVDLCERALKLIDDGPIGLRLRILLAEAHFRAGDASEARRLRLRVAADAERSGVREAQLEAALDHDRPLEIGEHHPEDQAMLERLLDVLPPTGPERVAATARLAVVAHHGPDRERHLGRADEALALARRVDHPGALARALAAKRFDAERAGHTAEQRRRLTAELTEAVTRAGWESGAAFAAGWQVRDRWEAGDGLGFRAGLRHLQEVIERLHEPFWLLPLRCLQAAEALAEGRFEDAETRLRATSAEVGGARADTMLAITGAMFMLRRSQGRTAELLPTLEGFDGTPGPWPGPRALALALSDRHDEARDQLDRLAADDWTAIPADVMWRFSAGCVAEAVALTGAAEHAGHWYAALTPAAGTAVVNAAIAWLPVDQLLGALARLQGDEETARAHFEVALSLARGLQAPTYEAEAQAALDAAPAPAPDLRPREVSGSAD